MTTTEVNEQRVSKLEQHIDSIYEKQATHSEALARVEASGEAMAGDIKYIVQQLSTKTPSKLTQWITIGVSMLVVIGTLSFAFIRPIENTGLQNTKNFNAFVTQHNDKELEQAEAKGRNEQLALDTKEFTISISALAKKNADRLTAVEVTVGRIGTGQTALGEYTELLGQRQYTTQCNK